MFPEKIGVKKTFYASTPSPKGTTEHTTAVKKPAASGRFFV